MTLQEALSILEDKTINQIENIYFNLDKNIYFTYELKPDFHDSMIEACKIRLNK